MTNVIVKCSQMLNISMTYEINLKYLLSSALLIGDNCHLYIFLFTPQIYIHYAVLTFKTPLSIFSDKQTPEI